MRRARNRLMSSISSVCRRRRAVFRNAREYQFVKMNNRRSVAVRFNAATREISDTHINHSNTQRALNSLVSLKNTEKTFQDSFFLFLSFSIYIYILSCICVSYVSYLVIPCCFYFSKTSALLFRDLHVLLQRPPPGRYHTVKRIYG